MIATGLAAVATILIGFFAKLLSDEFKAWNPRLTRGLLDWSVHMLPESQRERYQEEWAAHLDDTPGDLGKFFVAAGFLFAARDKANSGTPFGPRAIFAGSCDRDRLLVGNVAAVAYLDPEKRFLEKDETDAVSFYVKGQVTYADIFRLRWAMLKDWAWPGSECFGKTLGHVCSSYLLRALKAEAVPIPPRFSHGSTNTN